MNRYYSDQSAAIDERAVIALKHSPDIKRALSGGYESISYPGYPTGLIKIKDGDVKTIDRTKHKILSNRLGYLIRIVGAKHLISKPKSLLHLNSYKKLESFNDFTDLEVETLINYGFPAIYCSYADSDGSTMSECSIDIIQDRLRVGSTYNRGIKFNLLKRNTVFYIDRKASTLFRTQHLKTIIGRECFSIIRPTNKEVREYANEFKVLIRKLEKTNEPALFTSRILDYTRRFAYTTVASVMFELTHYWLTTKTKSVIISNRIMQELDPGLKKHWTMRGFSLESSAKIADILEEKGLSYIEYLKYIQLYFTQEIYQYTGDFEEAIIDIALDNLFFAKINELENTGGLDPTSERINYSPKIPKQIRDVVEYDEEKKMIVFKKAFTTIDNKDFDKTIQDNEYIKRHLYKLAYIHVKESIGAEVLRLIKLNKLGVVSTPFQPDNRGEYFLLASGNEQDFNAKRVHVEISSQQLKIKELEKVDVSFAIKTYADFDPSLDYFLPEKNILSLKNTRAKQFMQVLRSKESYLEEIFSLYYSLKINKEHKHIVVAIPFFKERAVLINNILHFIKTHKNQGDLHILLVSNLEKDDFDMVLSTIEINLETEVGSLNNVFLYPVNTYEVNTINLWMSNKTLAFMLGVTFANHLKENGVQLQRYYAMEADIFNADEWWGKLSKEHNNPNDAIFLEFAVYARGELTKKEDSHVDIKENIFYELFEKPLMKIFKGNTTMGAITGSSYCFGSEAVRKLYTSITNHSTIQTIEWHVLKSINLFNVRSINVHRKIHYTSSVIDDRFGHRILGFIEGLMANYKNLMLSSFPNLKSSIKFNINPELLADIACSQQYIEAKNQAATILPYFEAVYRDILGEEHYKENLNSIINNTFDFEDWLDILMVIFSEGCNKPQNVIIEYLSSLQPLSVYAFESLLKQRSYSLPYNKLLNKLDRLKIIDRDVKESTQQIIKINIESNENQYIFSDIHGEFSILNNILKELGLLVDGIITLKKGSHLVFNGDNIDCYSVPGNKEMESLLNEMKEDRSVSIQNVYKTLGMLKQDSNNINSVDIHTKYELVNAYKTYKLLQLIRNGIELNNEDANKGNIYVTLGNHEVDLLNGGLRYLSLQKTFLLNLLGLNGAHVLELKDLLLSKKALLSVGQIKKFTKKPKEYLDSNAILNWLNHLPIGINLADLTIMHAGPTVGLVERIESGKLGNLYDIDIYLSNERNILMSQPKIYDDITLVDFKKEPDLLLTDHHRLYPFLAMYGTRYLCVGHSPYLHMQNMGVEITKNNILNNKSMVNSVGNINDVVFKLDSGTKIDPTTLQMIVLKRNMLATYKLNEGIQRIFYLDTLKEVGRESVNESKLICNAFGDIL